MEQIAKKDPDALKDEMQQAIEYNKALLNGRTVITDPFDPDATVQTSQQYWQCLNLNGDGVMGEITIPSVGIKSPIYHSVEDKVLEKGVGHLDTTSLPVGGPSTHCVLSGHTGLPSIKIFDNLDKVKEGDYFIISVLNEEHAYRVTSIDVVLPEDTDSLVIKPDEDLCTLVTCTPYGVNSHRLLVHAKRCEVPQEWYDRDKNANPGLIENFKNEPPVIFWSIIGLLIALVVLIASVIARKILSRKNKQLKNSSAIASEGVKVSGLDLPNIAEVSAPQAHSSNDYQFGREALQKEQEEKDSVYKKATHAKHANKKKSFPFRKK